MDQGQLWNSPRWGDATMEDKTKERWLELCEQAAVEQDHDKLMQLVSEIDRLLAEKEQRLRNRPK